MLKVDKIGTPEFKHACTKHRISHPTPPQNLGTMDQQAGNQFTTTVVQIKRAHQQLQKHYTNYPVWNFLLNNVTNIFVQSSKTMIFVFSFRGRPWYCWSTYCYIHKVVPLTYFTVCLYYHLIMVLTNLLAHFPFYIS